MPACPVSIRRCAAGAALVVACLGTAACGSDGESTAATPTTAATAGPVSTSAPPETTSTRETTTTAPRSEEDAILAAVDDYWRTVRAANDPPNPDHPDIAQVAADPARQVLIDDLAEKVELGHSVRLPDPTVYRHRVSLVEQHEDTAVARDCGVDDTIRYVAATGEVLNDAVVTNLMRIVLLRISGQWFVSEVIGEESWEGVAGCALD